MKDFSNYLFLLMANISQECEKNKIIRLFIDGINDFLPQAELGWLEDSLDNGTQCFEVCTKLNNYGIITCNPSFFNGNKEIGVIIQNASQMLAVILERQEQEQLLSNNYIHLEKLVEERTSEILSHKEKLEKSEEKFRSYIENAPDGIFVVNQNGDYIEVNNAACKLTGYTEEELLAMNLIDLVHPDSMESAGNHFARVIKEGKATGDFKFIPKNGLNAYWTVDAVKISDERFLGFAKDISKRKNAEDALEKRIIALTQPLDEVGEIRFEELFNLDDIQKLQDEFSKATGVASIITKNDGTPITKPSNFCRLCNDIIRKTPKGLANCLRSDAALGKVNSSGPTVQPCLSGGLWDAGASIKVGGRHIANWLIGQVRNETQDIEKLKSYADEIGVEKQVFIEAFNEVPSMNSEKFKSIADALYLLANQLSNSAYQNIQQARFISERERVEQELKIAKEKAVESDRLKSAFLANMSHEIRTPMNGIIGFSEMLLSKDMTDEKREYFTQIIIKSGHQLMTIVNDVLDISKIESGAVKILQEPVYLNEIFQNQYNFYLPKASNKGISFTYDVFFDDANCLVVSDKNKLSQVLSNLLSNALKFTSHGKVNFGYKLLDTQILFFVEDTGIGIDPVMHEKIFERFHQVELELSHQHGGTGLGLSICKKIVELMQGKIWVRSNLGEGAKFYFTIPYQTEITALE